MKTWRPWTGIALVVGLLSTAAGLEEGFVALSDGTSFAGWKKAAENPDTWKLEDGAFVTRGPRCHLFYAGDEEPFRNFHLKLEVRTEPGANGGVYFHSDYQAEGWPRGGFETQVNVSHGDWIRTGSLYGVANLGNTPVEDAKWWLHEVIVEGRTVTVRIDGVTVLQYTEPPGAVAGKDFERKLSSGTFALQAHDPGSVVHYRNIRVKRLES